MLLWVNWQRGQAQNLNHLLCHFWIQIAGNIGQEKEEVKKNPGNLKKNLVSNWQAYSWTLCEVDNWPLDFGK